ncbi:kremen protein 1-like [Ruditapes philippinarum]|uniref:kremen protein 1-like n=1 Tax=Ruditapes philippinarum TaxID=129788 RepID=UPI00295B41D2|nr:kremen protein 1-like [Ruditapes philippinarum]
MKVVGSRVKITCHKYFKEVSGKMHSVCQRNGSWSHYPSCIPNFKYIGCFEDRPDRILYERDIRPPLLTTDLCIRMCIEYDHKYALTEAGYACFCGDTLKNYPQQPENECNMPCQGNQSEMCGGSWRGSLYRHLII